MDRTERLYRIDQLLRARRAVSMQRLLDELEVSRATVKRDLEYMRERLRTPIVWDRALGGYVLGDGHPQARQYELPGLWFNASEIHALLTMRQLLENLQPGLLGPHVEPLLARIRALLDEGEHDPAEVDRRVRVLPAAARPVPTRVFEAVSNALLGRKRLELTHFSRSRNALTTRETSPQRLVHYRDNWYLDAWCHLRGDLRSFALDAVRRASTVDRRAKQIAERTLDARLGSGYGIFAGRATRRARLRFTAERARWVADETWHPRQRGELDAAGRYVLEIPYADDRELMMDVLRYGADVEVLAPPELREKVRASHAAAARVHRGDGDGAGKARAGKPRAGKSAAGKSRAGDPGDDSRG